MPLDSVCVSALASELRPQIVGGKIDKVQQPERDTVLLSIRSPFGNVRLVLCGGVGNARVHLTEAKYENPAQPPMFCMLLRKHLVGARISALQQPERERIIIFELDGYDEMGVAVKKQLVVEMIGRGTNIILVNADGIIIDCLRRVDAEMSSIRQVLPGLIYRLPISQTKPDFFAVTSEERRALWEKYDGQKAPDKWLLETFSCLSPLVCREIVHRCYGDTDCLPESMEALAEAVERGEFVPYMLLSEGKPKDFSFIRIGQYGADMSGECFPGFSALLDAFYTRRSQAEDLHRRTQSLRKTVKNAKDRVSRKLELQRIELEKTAKRDEKRRWADLITANLYRAKGGSSITVEDFYEEDYPSVTIPLDPMKTPQQNAAAYYKEYTKAKTAERYLTELIAQNSRDEEYLSSVIDEIDRVKSESDIADIRRELTETGYLRPQKNQAKQRVKETAPISYVSTGGYEILVGRSNTQNDRLTLKIAHKGDIWLHTQKIHGSHVIIRCAGEDVDEATLNEAASLAALHSQASAGGKVSVDYTRVKFVKKPQGSLPGMVIYTDYNTIIAEADEALADKLKR